MDKVKAGLRGLKPLQKIQLAGVVFSQMSDNPNFPNPEPSMAELHTAYLDAKRTYLAAMDRGRKAMLMRDAAVARLDKCLSRLAGYTNVACNGARDKLASSGFTLAKHATRITKLVQPTMLRVRATEYPGQVKVRWNRVPGALIYLLERKVIDADGNECWVRVGLVSRPMMVVGGLVPYIPEYFRVCAIGTRTESPYSNPAFGRAM